MGNVDLAQWTMPGAWGWGADHWIWASAMHGIWLVLLLALITMAAIAIFRRPQERPREDPGESPVAILDARYARGEIGRDEYLVRKRDLWWRSGSV